MTHKPPGPERFDAPPPTKQAYVGNEVRIIIPLRSVLNLRRIADELHGLATNLDYLSRRHDEPATILLQAYQVARRFNKNVAAIRAVGRPRKTAPAKWKHPNDY